MPFPRAVWRCYIEVRRSPKWRGAEIEVMIASECVSDTGKATCSALGGTCVVSQDGYYVVQIICFVLGLVTVVGYIIPQVKKLQG